MKTLEDLSIKCGDFTQTFTIPKAYGSIITTVGYDEWDLQQAFNKEVKAVCVVATNVYLEITDGRYIKLSKEAADALRIDGMTIAEHTANERDKKLNDILNQR